VEDRKPERTAGQRDAADGSPMSKVLGSTGHLDTATYVADRGADPTAAAQWLAFEEIFGSADQIESFSICLKEAARRADRVRVHGYLVDIVRRSNGAREAYGRIATLAKLGGGQ
jgi:hypothetical protein